MDAVLERCAGLDVHQETVVACTLSGPLDRKPLQEIRTFGTTTRELLKLSDWLTEQQCSHVAMESTGVLWKAVWNILDGQFTLVLGNAKKIRNVPGRKTDVKDAAWIASLLRCGLIESSFVPPVDIRDLRDLTRYRRKLQGQVTSEKNRIHKILQDANIKLTTYVSDLFGKSGLALLEAIVNGEVLNADSVNLSGIYLLTRASALTVLREPYMFAAEAKGLPQFRLLYVHALRNALLPVMTLISLRVAYLLTGAILVETVFSYPGMGKLLYSAIITRDYPLMHGLFLVFAVVILFMNLVTDWLYPILDPRIRRKDIVEYD